MGDALHYVDFHQLQIENKQYVSRIEERNDELLKVSGFKFLLMMFRVVLHCSNCLCRALSYRTEYYIDGSKC